MKIVVIGAGRMGKLICSRAEELGHEVLACGDRLSPNGVLEALPAADMILDFSHPDNLAWILEASAPFKTPLVEGTTGLDDEQKQLLCRASESVPVFFASNYSLGIAVLKKLVQTAWPLVRDSFEMEIIEKHHDQKKDAPSGTALTLLEAADPENEFAHVFGRQGMCPRTEKEIGVHAVRGGTLPGEHEVLMLGPDEVISLSHSAYSRMIFVNGALRAAVWLKERPAGLYSMEDLVNEC